MLQYEDASSENLQALLYHISLHQQEYRQEISLCKSHTLVVRSFLIRSQFTATVRSEYLISNNLIRSQFTATVMSVYLISNNLIRSQFTATVISVYLISNNLVRSQFTATVRSV